MLFTNSTANDFASSSLWIRMILGSGLKGINKIGKAFAIWESRRRETGINLTSWHWELAEEAPAVPAECGHEAQEPGSLFS